MKIIVFVSKTGDWLVSFVAAILATVMLLYGGYALGDTAMLYQGAFVSQNLMKYKPSVSVDEDDAGLNELLAINPDVRGWLTIDGTHVDYPIVQGEDDMEYVNKGVYGEFSLSGPVFLDSENTSDFSDCYNLLFGHHMANGAMFGDVVRFTDRTYFEKHQTGRLFYPDGRSVEITLYACLQTDAYDRLVYRPEVRKQENMAELLAYIQKEAVQYRDIGITRQDRLIGLSTCAEAETNGRVILFGRLEKEKQVNQT